MPHSHYNRPLTLVASASATASAFELVAECSSSEQAFYALRKWSQSAVHSGQTAENIEEQLLLGGTELLRLVLQEHFDLQTQQQPLHAALVESCGEEEEETLLSHRRVHIRSYESVFGTVEVQRTGYSHPRGKSVHPLDEKLNLPKSKHSHLVQKKVVKSCGRGPFDEAVEDLLANTAARISKRQTQKLTVEAAQDFEEFYEERSEKARQSDVSGPILVVGVDCKGVPARRSRKEVLARRGQRLTKGEKRCKKKMAVVASVHTTEPFHRTPAQVASRLMDKKPMELEKERPRPENVRAWASLRKSKADFFQEVLEEMKGRDPSREKHVVCVMDGERALKKNAVLAFKKDFPKLTLVLDIIHVIEYLWKAVYDFYGEGSAEARSWVRERLEKILNGQVGRVVGGIKRMATCRGLKGKNRKGVDQACTYFMNNKSRMRYDEYLEKGLPIGSGCVEGACGHLVKDRMERTGASWNVDGDVAEAVLKIRALDKSGDFDEYWDFHLSREKENNYPRLWQAA